MNIAEILKNVPKGTELYSPLCGKCTLICVICGTIRVETCTGTSLTFSSNGKYIIGYADSECMLFPSKENRDWNIFKKFDVNSLKPFDKVLVRDYSNESWKLDFYSHRVIKGGHMYHACIINGWKQCIPYNEETKHLLGKTSDY